MKKILVIAFLTLTTMSMQAQDGLTWYTDLTKATDLSIKENKPMFLFFTGSDWCGWCIRLQKEVFQPFEKAAAFFLFGALQQFFFDGNKRTSRFMMNGILMSSGMDAISIPAAKAQDFNEKMVRFYMAKDATEMMEFLVSCHPDAITIQQNNPQMD